MILKPRALPLDLVWNRSSPSIMDAREVVASFFPLFPVVTACHGIPLSLLSSNIFSGFLQTFSILNLAARSIFAKPFVSGDSHSETFH